MLDNQSQQIEQPDIIALRARQVVAFVARHWLALLLTSLFIFTALPFLAPVAMAAGWTQVGYGLYGFYSYFCHQLPQRSWFLFGPKLTYTMAELQRYEPANSAWAMRSFVGNAELGWKVAWSDRMVSFYFMVPVFGLVYALLRAVGVRVKPISWLVLAVLLAPIAVDGATHALNDVLAGMTGAGFRDTNAWLALLTGNAFPGFYAGDQLGTFNWWARLITGLLAALGLAFFTLPWLEQLVEQEFEQTLVK
jgi:uncharacterized membrane protein